MADTGAMSKSAKKRAAKAARDTAFAEQNTDAKFAAAKPAEKEPAPKAAKKAAARPAAPPKTDAKAHAKSAAKKASKPESAPLKQQQQQYARNLDGLPMGKEDRQKRMEEREDKAKAQEAIRKAEEALKKVAEGTADRASALKAMTVTSHAPVTLTVVPGCDVVPGAEVPVLVSVRTPAAAARSAVDIVIVLDVSGSMGQEATVMGAGGASESNGLSLLDVAKHGVRTVVKSLQAQDRFSLVLFNNEASTAVPLTIMDEAGQKLVEDKLEEFNSGGCTDIWKGLAAALQELEKAPAHEPARLAHIMLLTDGESQNREQIVPNLLQFKEAKERLPGTVSTFGFGYNIDSALLIELAHAGDGTYSFIPDAGFVGTVFVNTLSNLLVTLAREACLKLEPEEGVAEIVSVRGGYKGEKTSWGMRIPIGTLQYDQKKDVIVVMRISGDAGYLSASAVYEGIGGIAMTVEPVDGGEEAQAAEVEAHCFRSCFVELLAKIAALVSNGNGKRIAVPEQDESARLLEHEIFGLPDGVALLSREEGAAAVARLAEIVKASPHKDMSELQALLQDMEGQVTEALSQDDWWGKWGRHYTPSLLFAHKSQQCNNFKDPGVQVYGGELFKTQQDAADEMFNQLPAPKPSTRRASYVSSAPISMSTYNNCYGG